MNHNTNRNSVNISRFITIFLMALALLLPKALSAAESLKLATDERGKFFWIMGTKIATALNESGIPTDVIITGGDYENLQLLLNSKADIALVSAPTLNSYLKENGGDDRFSTITALWPRVIHYVLLDKYIKTGTLADFHRRRIYLGPEGSLERQITEEVFRSMEIKTKRLVMKVDELNIIEIMTNYIVHKLDGAVFIDYVPSPTLSSIISKTGHYYKMIPAGKEATDHLSGPEKGYFLVEIPEDVYPYQHEKYVTIGVGSYLISRRELSDDTANKLVEAIFNNVKKIERDFNYGLGLKGKNGAENLVIPLHPGADKYFKETR